MEIPRKCDRSRRAFCDRTSSLKQCSDRTLQKKAIPYGKFRERTTRKNTSKCDHFSFSYS
ncbi:hypothetical protein PN462_18425 [Spirulina sp. CS-785/01]|uniref:hypothetical protein n=1 Tax=Spirulina sp. CS-785/01 TaxID=3021716 RepID=UPI002330F624|nr:hypothetical protein [Spirulina sp. CS-785/01]MDB9315097.1 hypothetical protein [Spirulina sp. CS-785/01]